MSSEQWSEWIEWSGGDRCPVPFGTPVDVKFRCGETEEDNNPEEFYWIQDGDSCDIIAYRYKIEEPEINMHPDLEWLARNVSECPEGAFYIAAFVDEEQTEESDYRWFYHPEPTLLEWEFTKAQWLQARKDLGLIMSDEEEEMPAEERTRTAPDFLSQAASIMQERGKQYDQPGGERSMGKTIAAFSAITGRDLSEPEGWMLMGLLKTVRQYSGDYHQDSAEDKIAYAALEAESLEASALRARELEQ